MKKLMALLLALAMALALISCGSKPDAPAASSSDDGAASSEEESIGSIEIDDSWEEEVEELMDIQIGSSIYYTSVSEGYEEGDLTEEDIADGQIAYYYRDDDDMDFDIYQFPKAGEDATDLLDYVKKEAAEYGVTEGVGDTYRQVDDLMIYEYQAEEEYEGKTYLTTTYVWEDDVDYFEIVCWADADSMEQQMDAHNLGEQIRAEPNYGRIWLSDTHYTISAPGYYQAENEDLYMVSDNSSMDFDIYSWEAEEGDTLIGSAEDEAEDLEVVTATINGIEFCYYIEEQDYDDETFSAKNCFFYDDDAKLFVKIVFWLDGDTAAEEVETILNTLEYNTEEF